MWECKRHFFLKKDRLAKTVVDISGRFNYIGVQIFTSACLKSAQII